MITFPKNIGGTNDFAVMVGQVGEQFACQHLGIHRTTLKRYLNGPTPVPRAYLAALYWETPWGRAQIDSDHLFQVHLLHNTISFLRTENERLIKALTQMESLIDFGSANSPVLNLQRVR